MAGYGKKDLKTTVRARGIGERVTGWMATVESVAHAAEIEEEVEQATRDWVC